MARSWNCISKFALAGLLLTALVGCGPVTIRSNPATFPVPGDAASQLKGGQRVTLANAYAAPAPVTVFPSGVTWVGDVQEYTATAITMVTREMSRMGVDVAPGAPKTATLKVHSVACNPGFTIPCALTLESELGGGAKLVHVSRNNSPMDAHRALDGAIMQAVTQLLRDQRFQDYVNK